MFGTSTSPIKRKMVNNNKGENGKIGLNKIVDGKRFFLMVMSFKFVKILVQTIFLIINLVSGTFLTLRVISPTYCLSNHFKDYNDNLKGLFVIAN
jgi:hypothetical protein